MTCRDLERVKMCFFVHDECPVSTLSNVSLLYLVE